MALIKKLLIANRGEVACRIIRTCKKMGIETVAVYSEADRGALHVKLADEAIAIGPSSAIESYLSIDGVMAAVLRSKAKAVHPGYGFLSENAAFAKECEDFGITFVGPSSKAIEIMGSKTKAKSIAAILGVPLAPAFTGEHKDQDKLKEEAANVGYPLLIKAVAGGGGRGMRICNGPEELQTLIESAQREAFAAFGNGDIFLEKYFVDARHIEIQILMDAHGEAVHLFERECSIQRRHQKIIEEAPSPLISETMRSTLSNWSIQIARAVNYRGAGTVEFIFDVPTNQFYFLEMNTRLQVEHPVTELITGIDIVEQQIRIAQGEPLKVKQKDIPMKGHAIECRIYAEDSGKNFAPNTGTIEVINQSKEENVRYDSGIEVGSVVSVYYDPMLCKITTWGNTRQDSFGKMIRVLGDNYIFGVTTNQNFLKSAMLSAEFQAGNYNTCFVDRRLEVEAQTKTMNKKIDMTIASLLWRFKDRQRKKKKLKGLPSGWRNNFYSFTKEIYKWGEESFQLEYRYWPNGLFEVRNPLGIMTAEVVSWDENRITCRIQSTQREYFFKKSKNTLYIHSRDYGTWTLSALDRITFLDQASSASGEMKATMPGKILKILVQTGAKVKSGDCLIVVESMKMEASINAAVSGTVKEISVKAGDVVDPETHLISIEESA